MLGGHTGPPLRNTNCFAEVAQSVNTGLWTAKLGPIGCLPDSIIKCYCTFALLTLSDQRKQGVKMPDNKTRKILRLPYFDYSQEGVYFVTLVTQGRTKLFSEVNQEEVGLFPAGKMVERWWHKLAEKFLKVKPREYIIMPNHFHGRIASQLILLYKRTLAQKGCYPRADFGSAEGVHDESTQQAGND